MELKDFIKQTLINIAEGVREASEPYKKDRKEIYDRFELTGKVPPQGMNENDKMGTFVDFDIAVIVTENKEDKTKSGIGVALANLVAGKSLDKKEGTSAENTHRLKFEVFVSKK